MFRRLAALPVVVVFLVAAHPAAAQDAGQSRTTIGASQAFSVKGKFTVFTAAGLDLDLLGDVTAGAIGTVRDTQTLVQAMAFPDVYVKTQRRRYVGASFGISKKNEVVVRYQDANNPASTIVGGSFGTNDNRFNVSFDNYKDRVVEFGLRHFMATPKLSRQYFSILYGRKTVEAISMEMRPPGGPINAALYSKSTVATIGVELGIELEFGHAGVFLESGMRWQGRLTRDDTDLARYDMTTLNNTTPRLYLPAVLGLRFRF